MFSAGKVASVLLGACLTPALVAVPYRVTFDGSWSVLLPQTAEAQESGEGSGSGDTSDTGSESGAGSTSGEDEGTEAEQPVTDEEQEQDPDPGSDELTDPVTGNDAAISDVNLEVVHPNGMREEIRNGRYEMFDAQGRIIVIRPATKADLVRLLAMSK